MKKIIITLIVVAVVVAAGIFIWNWSAQRDLAPEQDPLADTSEPTDTGTPETDDEQNEEEGNRPESVIGTSADGNAITAYHFGEGDTELLFVGGIHGGYSWNTALVAQELVDHLKENPDVVPQGVKVTVIPVLNPDGLNEVAGTVTADFTQADVSASQTVLVSGRFNGNNVDLNRNFDCEWQPSGVWQSRTVSGGSSAFSEPESRAVRDYVAANKPAAVVAWYSSAGGVYASNCGDGILSETRTIMNAYADASGYPAYENFDFYAITGDMVNWFAKNDIPAISVLLTDHQSTEWTKNRAGIEALLEFYAD